MSSHKGKLALLVGLVAGVTTGVLFTPVNGKKFREKIKKEVQKGGLGTDSLYSHFKNMAEQIKISTTETVKDTGIDKKIKSTVKNAKSATKSVKKSMDAGLKHAESATKKSIKIAKEATEDIKHEFEDAFTKKKD